MLLVDLNAHLQFFNVSDDLSQVLRPAPSQGHQLSQEEVRSHLQHPTQEEAEVNWPVSRQTSEFPIMSCLLHLTEMENKWNNWNKVVLHIPTLLFNGLCIYGLILLV